MHEIYSARNGKPRIKVISHATAKIESKREVLSLRPFHPFGFLRVNIPETEPEVKVGAQVSSSADKITPDTHVVRPVPGFRSPRNGGEGPAESHIPIAPQNPRPFTSPMCHRKEAMLGSSVYFSGMTLYPPPARKSK